MVNESDLKAGHAPATKVGGMRVRTRSRGETGGMAGAGAEEAVEVVEGQETDDTVATGAPLEDGAGDVVKVHKDLPNKDGTPESVKSFHEKPAPTRQIHNQAPPATSINQPRRQN